MEMFDLVELRKVIVNTPQESDYFLSRLYPEQMNFDGPAIAFDDLRNGRQMAPFVAPNVQGRVMRRRGYYTRTFTPAYIKPKDVVEPGRMLRRRAGEAIGAGTMSPAQRWEATIADYQQQQVKEIRRRWEWMAAQAALNGEVMVSGEDYPEVLVSFGRNADHTVVLVGGAQWSETTAAPLDDLELWAGRVADAEGFPVTRVTMGTAAWRAFRKNAEVKDLLDTNTSGNSSSLDRTPGRGEKVRSVGNVGGFQIYVYSDVYEDELGVTQPMMDPRDVFLEAADGFEGVRAFGAIMDADAGLQPLDIFSKMWKNPDPSVVYLLSQSAPLMIPSRPNCTLRARVVA